MSELDNLMEKLTEDPHREKAGGFYMREENPVSTDDLMQGLDARVDRMKAEHEAEREKERQAQEDRIRLHPDQYEKLQMERKAAEGRENR